MIIVVGDETAPRIAETPPRAAFAGCGKLTVSGIKIPTLIVGNIAEIRLGEFVSQFAYGGENALSYRVVKVVTESLIGL